MALRTRWRRAQIYELVCLDLHVLRTACAPAVLAALPVATVLLAPVLARDALDCGRMRPAGRALVDRALKRAHGRAEQLGLAVGLADGGEGVAGGAAVGVEDGGRGERLPRVQDGVDRALEVGERGHGMGRLNERL
jgi:hypothetical protein